MKDDIAALRREIAALPPVRIMGRVARSSQSTLRVAGLSADAALGDRVKILRADGPPLWAEIVECGPQHCTVQPEGGAGGVAMGDAAILMGPATIAPHDDWLGRIVAPDGQPLDGGPLRQGTDRRTLTGQPPPAVSRRRLGARLQTGLAVFDTLLPIARGQRVGLFAGSGVGKSTLLGDLAKGVAADIVVIALIGERGRELREFVEATLGPQGMARAVLIVATSDQPALLRRRCAWAAMAVAEHFRDRGDHVLFLADSVTRFAEAHREIALAAGESASLRGYPPSVAQAIMGLAERAGPGSQQGGPGSQQAGPGSQQAGPGSQQAGPGSQQAGPDSQQAGDITAIFSVLVPGSDMEEPVADILRGTLDGHVVLDRAIAERGRFPAVDLLRSVSRSLPQVATEAENARIARTRRLLGAYERAEMMVRAGLYAHGSDPLVDAAIEAWPQIDAFIGAAGMADCEASFALLDRCLEPVGTAAAPVAT